MSENNYDPYKENPSETAEDHATTNKGKDKRGMTMKDVLDTLIYVAVVVVLTFLFIYFVAQVTKVDGNSMQPTLHDEDTLIVEKVSYKFSDPKRFDIVVFPFDNGGAKPMYFIKRIIGLPGETVNIDRSGNIFINGNILNEHYGKEVILDPGRAIKPVTLGEDEYFVMGDNRNNSMDSRDPLVGNIHKKELIGRAFMRVFPFQSFGLLKHQ